MSLVTQCPKCGSEYDVTADQLKLHDGLVRCGQCSNVFDGLASLKDSLPTLTRKAVEPKPSSGSAPHSNPQAAPVLDVLAKPDDAAQEPAPVPTPAPAPAPAPAVPTPSDHPTRTREASGEALSGQRSEPSAAPTPTPEPRVDDGPFIPSVDRLSKGSGSVAGRFEPRLGGGQPAVNMSTTREPSLGALLNDDGEQAGIASRTEPTIKVMGESRLRGDDPSAAGRTMPEFLEDEDEPSFGARVYWVLGSIVLAVVLLVQSLVVFRNDLVAAVPAVRPLLVSLCAPLGCEVSYVRQIERIFVVGAALQQAPEVQSGADIYAYNLRFTLQNRGPYPQPWPALMVTLTDASGTPVIKKALMPEQFLSAELLAGPFGARQEEAVDIPLKVEGMSIGGFELNRFFP